MVKIILKIAKIIGDFQARLILTLFYLLIIFPFGIIINFFVNPLKLKRKKLITYWENKIKKLDLLEEAKKQF
ncbi:MAG: hypothetical protein HYU63_03570 [Armatimonadetes bacterium]|nr:hypothetical protein [Armatimonadota bacterium]